MGKKEKHGNGKWKYSSISALMLAMVLIALLALNVGAYTLEKNQGWRLDFSFNGILSQRAETKAVLDKVTEPVEIYALFRKSNEREEGLVEIQELLDKYAAASDKISWKLVDPALNPTLLQRFTTENVIPGENTLIVWCEKTGRFRVVGGEDFLSQSFDMETGEIVQSGLTYERGITSAIAYVIRDRVPEAVILQGHKEYGSDELQYFENLLEANQYKVKYQTLKESAYTPDPADLLIFFCPQMDLTETELEKMTDFAQKGGSFLFVSDYDDPLSSMPNYTTLLRNYGFIPLDGMVVADTADADSYYRYVYALHPEMCSTDLTISLIATESDYLLLNGSRAFATPEEGDRNLSVDEVLRSGETAYLKDANATSSMKEPEDPTGPFSLALQARRVTTDGYVSRAFIIGDSAVLTSRELYEYTNSMQFVVQVMDSLLQVEESGVQVSPKDIIRPGLKAASSSLGSILLVAMPLLVLLAALLVMRPRRNA